jgi:hypothetical protein
MTPLEDILRSIGPEYKKWATVAIAEPNAGPEQWHWYHQRGDGLERDFWPASTIKLYAAIAALERLAQSGFTATHTTVIFERQASDGRWILDTARSMVEMLSEVFIRSSNPDYTLLLRITGIDWINTRFLIPEKGFPHSALMRGYVVATARPFAYVREEPQRITLMDSATHRTERWEHTWSGRFYAEERGCTIIDARTGNVTSTREAVECLRRLICHPALPAGERYAITQEQWQTLMHGHAGCVGMEVRNDDSGPFAWTDAAEKVFPKARFYHKCGTISNYAMDLAAIDDSAHSGKLILMMPVIAAGGATKPISGETFVTQMARAICEAVRDGRL